MSMPVRQALARDPICNRVMVLRIARAALISRRHGGQSAVACARCITAAQTRPLRSAVIKAARSASRMRSAMMRTSSSALVRSTDDGLCRALGTTGRQSNICTTAK